MTNRTELDLAWFWIVWFSQCNLTSAADFPWLPVDDCSIRNSRRVACPCAALGYHVNLAPELIFFWPLAQGMVLVGQGHLLVMKCTHVLFFNWKHNKQFNEQLTIDAYLYCYSRSVTFCKLFLLRELPTQNSYALDLCFLVGDASAKDIDTAMKLGAG